jgi:hypothetical protein
MLVFCGAKHFCSALGDRSRAPACGWREIQGGSFFANFFGGTKKFNRSNTFCSVKKCCKKTGHAPGALHFHDFLYPLFLEKSGVKNRSLIIFFPISSSARRTDLQTRSRTSHRYALWISLHIPSLLRRR